jgi:hypothetical protein
MNADNPFRQLEPPPGGAERFAQRLDDAAAAAAAAPAGAPSWRPFAVAGAAAAAAALVVAVVLLREPRGPMAPVADSPPAPEIYNSPAFDRLLGRPLQAEELTAVVNKQAASVTELESHNEKVRIYQVN